MNQSIFVILGIVISLTFGTASCKFDCVYRPSEATLKITAPKNDAIVTTDSNGFISVGGISSAVFQQTCPNNDQVGGEVFVLVNHSLTDEWFIQDHTKPDQNGLWVISNVHLGETVPAQGDMFNILAIAIDEKNIETVISLGKVTSESEIPVEISSSDPIKVTVE